MLSMRNSVRFLCHIQLADGVHDLSQCLALSLLAELPVGHFFDLPVGDAVGQPGHGVGTDVTAMLSTTIRKGHRIAHRSVGSQDGANHLAALA